MMKYLKLYENNFDFEEDFEEEDANYELVVLKLSDSDDLYYGYDDNLVNHNYPNVYLMKKNLENGTYEMYDKQKPIRPQDNVFIPIPTNMISPLLNNKVQIKRYNDEKGSNFLFYNDLPPYIKKQLDFRYKTNEEMTYNDNFEFEEDFEENEYDDVKLRDRIENGDTVLIKLDDGYDWIKFTRYIKDEGMDIYWAITYDTPKENQLMFNPRRQDIYLTIRNKNLTFFRINGYENRNLLENSKIYKMSDLTNDKRLVRWKHKFSQKRRDILKKIFGKNEGIDNVYDGWGQDFEEEDWTGFNMLIEIDDVKYDILDWVSTDHMSEFLPILTIYNREEDEENEFFVSKNVHEAGKAARRYYEDMDDIDIRDLLGDEAFKAWDKGEWYAPGTIEVKSFKEWLDLIENYPEDTFGIYDGDEHYVSNCSLDIIKKLGFDPTICYRKD